MEARVKLLGHPIHQMLIVLPLGMLTGAVIFDVVGLFAPGAGWGFISFWLIAAGVLSGLAAAVFGFLDWTKIPRGTRARRIGALHGLGNVVLVTLFAASWLLRLRGEADPSLTALVLAFAGAGLSMVTGWLGGELVDRLGVGVDDGANLNAPSSLSHPHASAPASGD